MPAQKFRLCGNEKNPGLSYDGGYQEYMLAPVEALVSIPDMLAGKYEAKYISAAGWLALAIGMYVSTVQLDTLISFKAATILRLIQSVGFGLLFVPVTMAGYIGMPAERANNVAGIINVMRDIGSSVESSMVTTLLARRAQVHQVVLPEHTSRFDWSVQNHGKALSLRLVHSGASVVDAPKQARGLLYRAMGGQAATLAYIDIFWVLTIAGSIMFLLAFIFRKNDPKAGGVAMG